MHSPVTCLRTHATRLASFWRSSSARLSADNADSRSASSAFNTAARRSCNSVSACDAICTHRHKATSVRNGCFSIHPLPRSPITAATRTSTTRASSLSFRHAHGEKAYLGDLFAACEILLQRLLLRLELHLPARSGLEVRGPLLLVQHRLHGLDLAWDICRECVQYGEDGCQPMP